MRRIAIVTNIPTPYRNAQWEHIAGSGEYDIEVIYCARTKKGRYWKVSSCNSIKERFLRGVTYKGYYFNPGILKILRMNFKLFIIGGYAFPTAMMAIVALKMIRRPYVLAIDGVPPKTLERKRSRLLTAIQRFLFRGACAYFASGTTGKRYCQRFGVTDNMIFNQFLTVDVDAYFSREAMGKKNRESIREKHGITTDTTVALYCGRLDIEKGIQDLIKAVGKLREGGRDIVLLIVGEGEYRSELEKCAAEYKGSIIFTGHIDPEEIHNMYYASDMLVLPTYRDHWGLVVNEAMACSLPVVVSKAAGCYPDLVDHGRNGYVIEPGNIDQIMESLESLLSPETRGRFGEASRNKIRQWTYRESTAEFERMMNYLFEGRDELPR